jgi:hypothetical protein
MACKRLWGYFTLLHTVICMLFVASKKKTEQNLLQSAPTIFHTAATLPFEYQP